MSRSRPRSPSRFADDVPKPRRPSRRRKKPTKGKRQMTSKTTTDSKTRDAAVARVDDLLRGKLIDIRTAAMELSAIMQFGKPSVDVTPDPPRRFPQQASEQPE